MIVLMGLGVSGYSFTCGFVGVLCCVRFFVVKVLLRFAILIACVYAY